MKKRMINSKHGSVFLRTGMLFMLFLWIAATAEAQENVTVSAREKTVSEVFQMIERQARYVFSYEEEVKPELRKTVTINVKDKPIGYVMTELLKKTDLYFKVSGRQVLVYKKQSGNISGNPSQITGHVADENGEPLIGATIAVKSAMGETLYTMTGTDGSFHLNRRGDETSITASFVGYEKSTIKIREGGVKQTFRLP